MWIIPTKQQNNSDWKTYKEKHLFMLQKYEPSNSVLNFVRGTVNSLLLSHPFKFRIILAETINEPVQPEIFVIAVGNSKKELASEWNQLEQSILPDLLQVENQAEQIRLALSKIEGLITNNSSNSIFSISSTANL